jgi:type II secretory pathway pseudopilin PulG
MVIGILAAIAIPAFLKQTKKAKRSEAELNLQAIEKGAKAAFVERGSFPVGDSGVTPSFSCCDSGRPDRKCEPEATNWVGNPVWDDLSFEMYEPHFFRYEYSSADGSSFVAKAIGDLDCDGTDVEYVLEGTSAGGSPQFTVTKPSRAD